jgi:hypothetical protein
VAEALRQGPRSRQPEPLPAASDETVTATVQVEGMPDDGASGSRMPYRFSLAVLPWRESEPAFEGV